MCGALCDLLTTPLQSHVRHGGDHPPNHGAIVSNRAAIPLLHALIRSCRPQGSLSPPLCGAGVVQPGPQRWAPRRAEGARL